MEKLILAPESAHSVLGPSSSERWIECPGSVLATRGMPDEGSVFAISGTAAHAVTEKCRRENVPAKNFLGWTVRVQRGDKHTDVTVDAAMVASVQEFVDKVNEHDGYELIEARIHYEQYVPGGFGGLDSAKLSEGVGRVTDFKDGQGHKKYAKNNSQLMLYALGIYLEFDWAYDFKKFIIAISQPRLGHYDEWEISVEDLLLWAKYVAAPAAAVAMEPGAPFKAGSWCESGFCKIRKTCKVRVAETFENAIGEFVDLDASIAKTDGLENRVPTLTNAEVAKILKAWPNIEKFGKSLKAHAAAEVLAGREVGDMKFVEGRDSRSFNVSAAEVVEAVKKAVPDVDVGTLFTKPELLPVPQLEEVVGTKYFRKPTKTKPEPGPLLALVKKSPGKPTLVSGDDPRPKYEPDPTTDFDEVTEEE